MKLIIYILLLFNPIISFGQTTFFNSYGGAGNDYGKSIITTIDTAYTIIGATESFGNGNTDMYLFKIDSLGNLLWSKTYGGTNVDWGMDLKQTLDTGYILTGYSNSQSWDYNIYVVKTDSIGNSLWTRTYGGNDWDFSYSIETTSDSGYIIAGETYSYGSGLSDGYAIKLDSLGDTTWTKTFGGVGNDVFYDVIETYNGNLLFAGSKTSIDGDTDYWLVKTDNYGNELWEYTAGDSLDEVINDVIELTDSNYYFIGTKESINGTNLDAGYQKISKNGIFIFGTLYDAQENDVGQFISQYQNETDIILGGSTSSYGNGERDVLSIKISQSGLVYTYITGGTSFDDIAEEADTTSDKGLVIVGTTTGTINGIKSVFVMKKDESLNADPNISEVFDVTNINQIESEKEVRLYPNPTTDKITIKGIKNSKNISFIIYNVLGESVATGKTSSNSINLKNLNTGIYFINIPSISNKSYPFTKI